MRIGIDARMYGKAQSGIGNYIQQITKHIFQLDQENEYFLFMLEPAYSRFPLPNNRVHKILSSAHWYSYAEQTKFLGLINKYQLDLMHFPHFNAPILYNRKRVTTIHDITPKFFPGHKQKSWWRKKAYELTIKTSLQKSAKIIADSMATKQDLLKYFNVSADKIAVVYLGIESDFKKIENYAKIKELTDKYQITKPFIFFLSVWRNHKNFEGLIKAFEILKKQDNFDYQLVLGGQEDPHYPNIRQAINSSEYKNDIITPGFIADQELPLFYNAAKIFVIPSFYEGFGLIGLEAMACSLPVIASQTTSLPEILGDAALYFEPNNHQQIAELIKKVLTDDKLQEDLRQKGFVQSKKYSWQECALKTLEIYQQILTE